jgi:hypothetical protein
MDFIGEPAGTRTQDHLIKSRVGSHITSDREASFACKTIEKKVVPFDYCERECSIGSRSVLPICFPERIALRRGFP